MTTKTIVYSYVRFSTSAQALGASQKRQTEAAERYVAAREKEGWVLDRTLKMADLGVSAYTEKNITEGALGDFIQKVKDKEVAPGSVLLVENLDRLSRAEVMTAMEKFLGILRQGIRIVTLIDGQEYSSETLADNPYRLILSLVSMIRAHEESATKGARVADAWKRKRDLAIQTGKPLTKQCPYWLTIETDPSTKVSRYVLREDRVKLVEEIFEKLVAGWGQGRIAAEFNRRKIPTWGGKRGVPGRRWHDSYVQLISKNRAVLGECQLYTGNGKDKRSPVGEPMPHYFPAIISPDLFTRVSAARQARRVRNFVGRQGVNVSNLFQGLVYDLDSKRRCVYISHGKKTNWQYITPPFKAKNQRGWNYTDFERVFLLHCRLLDWSEVFGDSVKAEVAKAYREVELAKAEITSIDTLIARYTEVVANAPDVKPLVDKLRSLAAARVTAQKSLGLLFDAHQTAIHREEALDSDTARIQTLATSKLDTPDTRLRLREEIRRAVHRIDVNFTKRVAGRLMMVSYTNGATRIIRPNGTGDGVQIWDARECGFTGTPEQWSQGAGTLENDDIEHEEVAS